MSFSNHLSHNTKFNSLEEIDKLLEIYNLPRLNHEEMEKSK